MVSPSYPVNGEHDSLTNSTFNGIHWIPDEWLVREHRTASWSNLGPKYNRIAITRYSGTYTCICGYSNTVDAESYNLMCTGLKQARLRHEDSMKIALKEP